MTNMFNGCKVFYNEKLDAHELMQYVMKNITIWISVLDRKNKLNSVMKTLMAHSKIIPNIRIQNKYSNVIDEVKRKVLAKRVANDSFDGIARYCGHPDRIYNLCYSECEKREFKELYGF